MSPVIHYRVEPARNMLRFYRLDVQPDLFGFWLPVREWDRIGHPGRCQVESFPAAGEARDAPRRRRRAKERRGYRR